MSIFGIGGDDATATKDEVVATKEAAKKDENKDKKPASAAKDSQAAEAQAILAKMQEKADGDECPFC